MSNEREPGKAANIPLEEGLRPLQKENSGFRQKAEPSNFQMNPALSRDAATARGWFFMGMGL
jgi:hypothetical protein